jgi:hypothetical protein
MSLDGTRTIHNVIPLFDVSENPRRGIQAWHGSVVSGRCNDRLLDYLLPCYVSAFPILHSEFGRARGLFCDQLADIAALSKPDPIEQGWLRKFLSTVTDEERVRWVSSLAQVRKGMENAAKCAMWEKWLSTYWGDRLDGTPVPLTASEGKDSTEWSIQLGPVFPQVVAKSCSDDNSRSNKLVHAYRAIRIRYP